MIEPIRDPRLGRNEEAFSEDPLLCSRIAETIVRSAQGRDVSVPDKVVTGLCHYPGQSQPVSGLERGAMEVSERGMREVFLPPWQAGIQKCGALGVMATYPAIDGMPTHASKKMLDRHPPRGVRLRRPRALRGRRDRDARLRRVGGERKKRRGRWPWRPAWTWASPSSPATCRTCWPACREGKVPIELVDRSVRRVLKQKFRLGLFEKPLVAPEHAVATVHRPEHAGPGAGGRAGSDCAVEERPWPAAAEEDAAVRSP